MPHADEGGTEGKIQQATVAGRSNQEVGTAAVAMTLLSQRTAPLFLHPPEADTRDAFPRWLY